MKAYVNGVEIVLSQDEVDARAEVGKIGLLPYVAQLRWKKEISGAAWNGRQIDTDRESGQPKLLGEFVAIFTGQRVDPSPWKFADGVWLMLSNSDMGAVCLAARQYIASVYEIEAQITAAIAAGTITTTAEIDAAFA